MGYQEMKIRPLPPPKGLDALDIEIWHLWPDRWGDCASQRSKNKFIRLRMRIEKLKENDEVPTKKDE